MKHYKLRYVLHDPSEDTEDKYMAEIPDLPGCRAWGDTPEEALDILSSVAAATIEVRIERGYELPDEVRDSMIDATTANEVLVAVSTTGNLPANCGASAVNSLAKERVTMRFGQTMIPNLRPRSRTGEAETSSPAP